MTLTNNKNNNTNTQCIYLFHRQWGFLGVKINIYMSIYTLAFICTTATVQKVIINVLIILYTHNIIERCRKTLQKVAATCCETSDRNGAGCNDGGQSCDQNEIVWKFHEYKLCICCCSSYFCSCCLLLYGRKMKKKVQCK